MPISVQCPSCSAKLNAPDAAAGKRVKCPKCQTVVPIPAADPIEAAEVVDEPAPPPVKRKPEPADEPDDRPKKKASKWEDDEADEKPKKKSRRDDEEEDERPKKKSRREDDADDDDRPRRRSRRDDDDEDRPRSGRPRTAARSGQSRLNVLGLLSMICGIFSVIVTIFLGCCFGWVFGIVGGVASVVMGAIGMSLAKKSEGQMGGGMAIAGLVLGVITILFAILWGLFFAAAIATAPTSVPTIPIPTQNGNPTVGPNVGVGGGGGGSAVKITAEELSNALDDDEVAAHAKYDGKTVEVTGMLERVVDSGPAFPSTAELTAAKGEVRIDMAKGQQAKLAPVPFGGLVTIRARYQKDKTPVLTDGEVVGTAKHPDGTDAKVRLVVVTQEYKFDKLRPGAADARFKGKTLEVEWEVRKVNKGGPQGGTLEFNMDQPKAEARFAAKDAAAFAALKEGDTVKVRGTCNGVVNNVLVLEGCTLVE